MATINDKLTYIEGTKDAIKQAIIAKGVSVSDSDTFRSYAGKITSIQTGGGTTYTEGTKFGYSDWSTVPNELIPYLESTSNLNSMFYYCEQLTTVPQFNTSNANNMSNMFNHCSSLTTIPLFDASNVKDMNSMFAFCLKLTTVPQFNTSNANYMGSMFSYCSSLTTVPLLDVSKVFNNMGGVFNRCNKLTTLGGLKGLKFDLDLSHSSNLTVDSVMNIITEAADMTTNPKTLTLNANVYAKLSEQQIATATAKGWNIAEK